MSIKKVKMQGWIQLVQCQPNKHEDLNLSPWENWVWWHTPEIPDLWKQRQVHKTKINLKKIFFFFLIARLWRKSTQSKTNTTGMGQRTGKMAL